MLTRLTVIAGLLAITAACTPKVEGPDTTVLPDDRVLVDLPTDDGGADRTLGQQGEIWRLGAEVTGGVNGLITSVLGTIDEVVGFEPSGSFDDSAYTWGPWRDETTQVESRFWMLVDDDSAQITWGMQGRPLGSTDDNAYEDLVLAQIEPGATDADSKGWFAIDFDAAKTLNPAQAEVGKFVSQYELTGDSVKASAAFEDFIGDDGKKVDGIFGYDQVVGDAGTFDFISSNDMTGNTTDELVFVKVRWAADGAGRGDAIVTGGDVGLLQARASECWDTTTALIYEENNYEPHVDGLETDCAYPVAAWNEPT